MRTTLVIRDDLLTKAKKLAADRKSNVSEIVNDALRMAFKEDPHAGRTETFQIPTYRPGGRAHPDTLPHQVDTLLAAEDMGIYRK